MGKTQKSVFEALIKHKKWSLGCGWVWSTSTQTERILKSLAKRGLVYLNEDGVYYPIVDAIGLGPIAEGSPGEFDRYIAGDR